MRGASQRVSHSRVSGRSLATPRFGLTELDLGLQAWQRLTQARVGGGRWLARGGGGDEGVAELSGRCVVGRKAFFLFFPVLFLFICRKTSINRKGGGFPFVLCGNTRETGGTCLGCSFLVSL